MKPLALVTDGSPEAMATARWLRATGAEGRIIETGKSTWGDTWKHVPTTRFGRVVTLGFAVVGSEGIVDGSAAVEAARVLLADLEPIQIRTRGESALAEAVRAGLPGSAELERLQRIVAPASPGAARRRRGRPPGTDPFRGVGFDVSVVMLNLPGDAWTERRLAETTQRTSSAVHKILVELERRDYVRRRRGEARLVEPIALRDDLLRSWKSRVVAVRKPEPFVSPKRDVEGGVRRACKRAGAHALLAGAHAMRSPERLLGEPLTWYFDSSPRAVLEAAGFTPASRIGDLIGWIAPEAGVFLLPRRIGEREVVNRVIAFLDLASADSDRHQAAAEAVWSES